MKSVIIIVVAVVLVAVRVRLFVRRRAQKAKGSTASTTAPTATASPIPSARPSRSVFGALGGDVGLVAEREVRERTRGRVFRVGTVLILAGVAAAIVIPVLNSSKPAVEKVGVVGPLSVPLRHAITSTGADIHATIRLVDERDLASARSNLRSGRVDLLIVDAQRLIVAKPIPSGSTSTNALEVSIVASAVSRAAALAAADLSPAQLSHLLHPPVIAITSLQAAHKGSAQGTSLIGLIVVFVLLQQYSTWTLIGVAEEKSSRVVEVLLAAVRPMQLLGGKVLGIGLVALAQAGTILVFAVVLAKAVGSDLLQGTAPLELVSSLVWLVLGYAFYCWVYAAAGSMAERQDQLQSLSFPLSLPIILGYIVSLIVAESGSTSTFFDVLAYLPPTAPFAMPVLVGLGQATWWEFALSVVLSIIGTIVVARFAAGIYRRAILRTGRSLRFREVVSRSAS